MREREKEREGDGGEKETKTRGEQQIEQKPSETGRFVVARQWLEGIIHRCNRLRAPAQRSKLAWTVSVTRSELRYFEQRIRPHGRSLLFERRVNTRRSLSDRSRHAAQRARYYPCSHHIGISFCLFLSPSPLLFLRITMHDRYSATRRLGPSHFFAYATC